MKVAIIKYNAGNIHSVELALTRLGVKSILTDDPDVINAADKVIFPGQGEASSAMEYLTKHNLDSVLRNLGQPFLGICLGLQLMCKHSEENNTTALGIFDTVVKKFQSKELKIPQVGWNRVINIKTPLFSGIKEGSFFYFLHSFYAQKNSGNVIGETDYGINYASALQHKNYYAVQFHPEKSGENGEKLLKNFLDL
ncbi:MAG: imidazole glycerol phosphate synthase subunit HisH [Calditrichae bacterium]|nr:imidazole glycerol phosphate synthase subunit HisH [Calditrichota bacterium]MCB9058963.1 imidazole glycerol phosphate synthase subunit HisH [Calditrichia bacterium]